VPQTVSPITPPDIFRHAKLHRLVNEAKRRLLENRSCLSSYVYSDKQLDEYETALTFLQDSKEDSRLNRKPRDG